MKISEIFKSIQGETSYAGLPCTFIRLTGCNLRCSYCDTTYAYKDGTEMPLSSILETVHILGTRLVCITGGEPLLDNNTPLLVKDLLDKDYTVIVETNGACDISILPEKAVKIMDIKCPGSGMDHLMRWQNISHLTRSDEVKFVLSSNKDYEWAKDIIQKYNLTTITNVLMGTVYGSINPALVAEWILKDCLEVRLQLQIHKYIWNPEMRGI